MAKVICTLPNASELINGVAFAPGAGGMVSEEIDHGVAERFLLVPGFDLFHEENPQGDVFDVFVEAEPDKPARGRKAKQELSDVAEDAHPVDL